jgi:hypothetical protein
VTQDGVPKEEYLEFGAVRLNNLGAGEMDGRRALLWIPREEILRIEQAYGSAAERPLTTLLLGVLLVGLALLGPGMLVLAVLRNGHVPAKFVTSLAFVIPAFWLLDLSLRRRWFLAVHTPRGKRKLLFPRKSDPAAIGAFLTSAKSRFGYP